MNHNLLIKAAADVNDSERNDDTLRIQGVALSGAPLRQEWSDQDVYVDMAGLTVRQQVPLMYSHNLSPEYRLGVVECTVENNELLITGVISTDTEYGKIVADGFRRAGWQLSIGALNSSYRYLKADDTAEINGRTITGPALIVEKSELYEVSIVAVGADAGTSCNLVASFVSEKVPVFSPVPTINTEVNAMASNTAKNTETVQAQTAPVDASNINETVQAAITAETARAASVARICARHPELATRAAAERWSEDQARKEVLAAIEASYANSAPNVTIPQGAEPARVLQAALMEAVGTAPDTIANEVGAPAVEAAQRRFHGRIGLQQVIIEAAIANGNHPNTYRLDSANWREVSSMGNSVQAAIAPVNLTGLLGTVINRRLVDGYETAEQSWREIAEITSVPDFRQIAAYRLNSNGGFELVPNGGELHQGELAESTYTNQARTYGEMLTLTRQDIINDDLGALAKVPYLLGQDAGYKINEIFWATFLDDSNFFTAGNGNTAVAAGGIDLANLGTANALFKKLKNDAGKLIGGHPAILLCPTELEAAAESFFVDQTIIASGLGGSAKMIPQGNPFRSKFRPVSSAYLSDSAITGYSATSWYLLADPRTRAAITVAFLNGRQAPMVESQEADFNTLGWQYRAYLDFGVAHADTKAAVKITAS